MKKNTLIKTALGAGLVLTPAVIGRYGALAGLLRAEVLLGFGVVATLVALITLEYGRRSPARAVPALRTQSIVAKAATVVAFPARSDENRAAA